VPGRDGGGGDSDPAAANDLPPLEEAEGQPPREQEVEVAGQSLDAIRDQEEHANGSGWSDDLLLAGALAFLGGGLIFLFWMRRRDQVATEE
jgi:hypothetical protein